MARTITVWATRLLDVKLSEIALGPDVTTGSGLSEGFMSGDVSVSERKGKSFPIYSLEVELPWSGTIGGEKCKGKVRLPDISIEMLDDLEARPCHFLSPLLTTKLVALQFQTLLSAPVPHLRLRSLARTRHENPMSGRL